MANLADVSLLCLVRCYQRVASLAKVLDMAAVTFPRIGVPTWIMVAPDPRATPEVKQLIQDAADVYERVQIITPELPVMSPQHGQRWIEQLNWMCDRFDEAGLSADWVVDLDDDQLWLPPCEDTLAACLADETVDAWRSVTLYDWDGYCSINTKQYHWSPTIGRYRPGARRHTGRVIEIPDFVQDTIDTHPERQKTLPFYLLDVGTTDAQTRQRLYRDYARAGKLDPYTRRYVEEPRLMPLAKILADFPNPADFECWQRGLILGSIHEEPKPDQR